MTVSLIGADNGRVDPLSGCYLMGNGYRAFSPDLSRFREADSWSPFGPGGVNIYTFCGGDPVNQADSTGQMSWQAGVGIGLGVLGGLGTLFTAGTSLAAAGSLSAALSSTSFLSLSAEGMTLMSDVFGIASVITEDSAPDTSKVLGWLSFSSGVFSVTGKGMAHLVKHAVPFSPPLMCPEMLQSPLPTQVRKPNVVHFYDVYKKN